MFPYNGLGKCFIKYMSILSTNLQKAPHLARFCCPLQMVEGQTLFLIFPGISPMSLLYHTECYQYCGGERKEICMFRQGEDQLVHGFNKEGPAIPYNNFLQQVFHQNMIFQLQQNMNFQHQKLTNILPKPDIWVFS